MQAVMPQEDARGPSVLSGHERGLAKDAKRSQTDVLKVADRRCNDVERSHKSFYREDNLTKKLEMTLTMLKPYDIFLCCIRRSLRKGVAAMNTLEVSHLPEAGTPATAKAMSHAYGSMK